MKLTTRGKIETGMAIWAAVVIFVWFIAITIAYTEAYFNEEPNYCFGREKHTYTWATNHYGEMGIELASIYSGWICAIWTTLRYFGKFQKKQAMTTGKCKERLI